MKSFDSLYFKDSLIGFKFNVSQINKTTDGGNSWKEVQNLNIDCSFNNIAFEDSNTGFAIGYQFINHVANSIIIKTTDGGNSWSVDSAEVPNNLNVININSRPE